MPIYRYEPNSSKSCKFCEHGFEVHQSMSDAPLTKCPESSCPVERVITPTNINLKPSAKSLMKDDNLKRLGFQKLVKGDDGNYENTIK